MPNYNKQKGDRFESAALLASRGLFPDAKRTRAGFDDDYGDIILCKDPFVVVQAKDCGSKPWFTWLDDLDRQIAASGAQFGALCVKRRGVGDAGEAMAVMRYRNWLYQVHALATAGRT